uniref:Uncharacterized protein n=1 Tax=Brassica oleracea var. oleracea TaxID=109376 RepID=A0A0D3CX68_BRAOL
MDQTDQNVPDVPVEVHPTDQIRLTDRAVYQLDPRTSGLELRLDPRSDARIDRTEVRLSRPTRQAKTDEDLDFVGAQLVRSERPAALADRPAYVLILTALDLAGSDASGRKPIGPFD